MTTNGEGFEYKNEIEDGDGNTINYFSYSSRVEGHTQRARDNAPTNIVFNRVKITGVHRNPVYFAPGVTYSKLINSTVIGRSEAVAIYLDAESYGNTIKGNYIAVDTKNHRFEAWDRPLIAIDGSSHNKIMNNEFRKTSHGGIYLYRNCGEGWVIRHATPSYNQIINNIFYYKNYTGDNPAVYLGSHNRGTFHEIIGFCNDDAVPGTITESDLGSGASNKDYAKYNVVMQNQIFKRDVDDMIKTDNTAINSPNFIAFNHTVNDDTVVYNGLAVCYLPEEFGAFKQFLKPWEVLTVVKDNNGNPVCSDTQYMCNDGELISSQTSSCALTIVPFECNVSGNNVGCSQFVQCPANQRIVSAKAACNLEWGTISEDMLDTLPMNLIKVIRKSDVTSSGKCYIGSYSAQKGEKVISGIVGSYGASIGCREHDANGGDCHILGELVCH